MRRFGDLYLLSPHLHTHVVLANVGRGPEGAWSALDGRGIFAHRGAADALYHAQLRHELTAALGVAWEPAHGGRADVMGVAEEARRAFSRRSAEIAAHLASRGPAPGEGEPPSARASQVAALATRAPKDVTMPIEDLLPEWRRRAVEVGLGPRRLEALLGRVSPHRSGPGGERPGAMSVEPVGRHRSNGEERALTTAMTEALEAMDGRRSARPFTRRQVVRAWAASQVVGEPARDVEASVDRFLSSAAVATADPGRAAPRNGPGVAEGRFLLAEQALERDVSPPFDMAAERRQLDELLARRGMALAADRGRGPGRDLDFDLGR